PPLKGGDIPESMKGSVYHPSPDGKDSNLLLCFHGLGDTPLPFVRLWKQMALPQTALMSLQGPFPLLDLGYCWHESFDSQGELIRPTRGENRRSKTLCEAVDQLCEVMDAMVTKAGWEWSQMFGLGFSQGGCALMALML
ncbi:unnamed protein product, partial [Chrysoparadoxa australica]